MTVAAPPQHSVAAVVPTEPERIAVVGRRGTLPILLDLGVEPIARAVGDAVGLGEEAAELVADFEAEVDDAAAQIEDPGTVSIMGLFSPDDLRVDRSGNFVGQLVERLGGDVVPREEEPAVDPEDPIVNYVSLEQLDLLRGDRLITFVDLSEELQSAYRALEAEPVVHALPAFQRGEVLEVDPQLVFGTAGLTGLRELLDQLESFFAA